MSEEYFYHYTSKDAAMLIIHEGKILPSLKAKGDAVHGEGVYLTTLEPGHGEETIKNNNWDGVAATETKIEAFFEILIPSSKVVRAIDTRDIQVHEGPLQLRDYKWNLKNWEGKLLATQFFMVSSDGNAKAYHGCCMGKYSIVGNFVVRQGEENTFVYKQEKGNMFLYNCNGDWAVGPIAGSDMCMLIQHNGEDRTCYVPSKISPWEYGKKGWRGDDRSFKVFPCYF